MAATEKDTASPRPAPIRAQRLRFVIITILLAASRPRAIGLFSIQFGSMNAYIPDEIRKLATNTFLPGRGLTGNSAVNRWPARPGGKDMLANRHAGLLEAFGVTERFVEQRIIIRGHDESGRHARKA